MFSQEFSLNLKVDPGKDKCYSQIAFQRAL